MLRRLKKLVSINLSLSRLCRQDHWQLPPQLSFEPTIALFTAQHGTSWCVRADLPVAGGVRGGGIDPRPVSGAPAMAYPYRVELTEAHARRVARPRRRRRRPGPDADPRLHPAQGRPRRGARLVRRRRRRSARRQPQHRAARPPPVRHRRAARGVGAQAPWRAGRPWTARPGGVCGSSPTNWSAWRSWTPSPTRRCARRSKQRPPAVAERAVVPGPDRRSRLRLAHGGCPVSLRASARPDASGRLSR